MDFQLENCLAEANLPPVSRLQELLQFPHRLACILLDLRLVEQEVNRVGAKQAIANNLTDSEQELLSTFTSPKRQWEWIGGRFAAKYAAARLLEHECSDNTACNWCEYAINIDANGRPFLSAGNKGPEIKAIPDISISHSASLAAAMAAERGICGIDIQKITPKVLKVRDRFCSRSEMQMLRDSCPISSEEQLTELWAAKETLRKASNRQTLPGFLELELAEITTDPLLLTPALREFAFHLKNTENLAEDYCRVAVTRIKDYALALTARDDTVL